MPQDTNPCAGPARAYALNQASRKAADSGAKAIGELMTAAGTDDLGALSRSQIASTVLLAGAGTWMEPLTDQLTADVERSAARVQELEAKLADIKATAGSIRDRAQDIMERLAAETILTYCD